MVYNNNMDLKEKIKNLPQNSGVYLMHDKNGDIIYVGKAKVLKNRVSQYFLNTAKPPKVQAMVDKITDFEWIITNSELDALILESNLIKKYQPYYNILLKDGKSYPYIKINLKQPFPKVEITRRLKKDGARYFGPFFGGISVNELVKIINLAFPLRTCNLSITPTKLQKRECLNYSMGLCSAPCTGKISSQDYRKIIDKVISFLNGKDEGVYQLLNEKMIKFAKLENFEMAMQVRDRIYMLDRLKQHAVNDLSRTSNLDIFAITQNETNTVVSVMIVRNGKVMGNQNYLSNDTLQDYETNIISFITQYYKSKIIASEILLQKDLQDYGLIQQYIDSLSEHKVNIFAPKKGAKRRLVEQALKNANDYMELNTDKIIKQNRKTMGAVQELKQKLNLVNLPLRIEAYDISNISGTNSVASMVVFINGEKASKHYRHFKIKTVQGPNDFASLKEVITRRMEKLNSNDLSFSSVPSLMLIDGGKGQVSSTREIIKSYNSNIDVIGLAKREEEVFVEDSLVPIVLSKDSYSLKLLQAVRNEAHRFAITFHRSIRTKKQTESILDKIDGIGKVKKQRLLAKFKTVSNIKKASIDDLIKVNGITTTNAQNILKILNNN